MARKVAKTGLAGLFGFREAVTQASITSPMLGSLTDIIAKSKQAMRFRCL
jgi:hypothetical protein